MPRIGNKYLPLRLSLLERSFQPALAFFLCSTIANAIQQSSTDDRRVFVKAGLLFGMSPQGAHFQVFPALSTTVVSLRFQQPQQKLCASFPGHLPVPRASGATLVYSPRRCWDQASLSSHSLWALSYVTPFQCCLLKALHVFDIVLQEQLLVFQMKLEEHLHSSQCWAAKGSGSVLLPSVSAGKSILAPLPWPSQMGFIVGILWYLDDKEHIKPVEREALLMGLRQAC